MKVRLTPENVEKLRPRAGRAVEIIWDDAPSAPPAFGIRVRTTGKASYVIQYRTRHGTDRKMRVGGVGKSGLTLAAAREAARKVLERVAAGEDPATDRRADETAERLEDLVLAYIDHGKTRKGRDRAKKTTDDYRRAWAAHIKGSTVGRTKPADVTARAIEAWLSRRAADAPVMADRLHALVRGAFRWAFRTERVEIDPTARMERVIRTGTRDRVLADAELRALWLGIEAAAARPIDEEGPRLSTVQATATKALILLGQRLNETLRMRWADVDLSARTWSIPGTVRKGGRPHLVPLPATVVKLIEDMQPATGKRVYVFSGRARKGVPQTSIAGNPSRFAKAVRAATPDVAGWSMHDLRRTCATGCARLGTTNEVVGRLLGHASTSRAAGVTAVYQRYDRLSEVASALAAWAAHVARVVEGKEQQGADVVPISAGRA